VELLSRSTSRGRCPASRRLQFQNTPRPSVAGGIAKQMGRDRRAIDQTTSLGTQPITQVPPTRSPQRSHRPRRRRPVLRQPPIRARTIRSKGSLMAGDGANGWGQVCIRLSRQIRCRGFADARGVRTPFQVGPAISVRRSRDFEGSVGPVFSAPVQRSLLDRA